MNVAAMRWQGLQVIAVGMLRREVTLREIRENELAMRKREAAWATELSAARVAAEAKAVVEKAKKSGTLHA